MVLIIRISYHGFPKRENRQLSRSQKNRMSAVSEEAELARSSFFVRTANGRRLTNKLTFQIRRNLVPPPICILCASRYGPWLNPSAPRLPEGDCYGTGVLKDRYLNPDTLFRSFDRKDFGERHGTHLPRTIPDRI